MDQSYLKNLELESAIYDSAVDDSEAQQIINERTSKIEETEGTEGTEGTEETEGTHQEDTTDQTEDIE